MHSATVPLAIETTLISSNPEFDAAPGRNATDRDSVTCCRPLWASTGCVTTALIKEIAAASNKPGMPEYIPKF